MPSAGQGRGGRRVVVTGGCGFLGSRLVERLVQQGAEVRVLDRASHGGPSTLPAGVELVRCTLGAEPPEALEPHLRGADALFHLAAEKHSQAHPDPAAILRTNVTGTWALLDAATRAGVRKVVFASSLYAYGRTSGPPLEESEACHPVTVYGVSKLAGEGLLEHQRCFRGLEYVALRYFFIYGPGQRAGQGYRSVVWSNFERLLKREPLVVRGDGEQALDYVYVDDAVDAALVALDSSVSGQVFNVGSGQAVTINRLTDLMIACGGSGGDRIAAPADETAGSSRVARIDKISGALGWSPRVRLEQGLERTYAWLAREVPA